MCEEITSSTKPKVHNALHSHQTRAEPQPQTTCTENFVKFGRVIFETQADRQTDTQTH